MAQIAEALDGENVDWMEKVSDEQYGKLRRFGRSGRALSPSTTATSPGRGRQSAI
jgi:hypothetical protein